MMGEVSNGKGERPMRRINLVRGGSEVGRSEVHNSSACIICLDVSFESKEGKRVQSCLSGTMSDYSSPGIRVAARK